ncbi:dNMP kinase [Escherichia phage W115]|nr:dNMP kinase [Escherichia phage W115]
MKLIALCGKKRVGKDTAALIIDGHSYQLAAPIKEILCECQPDLGLTYLDFDGLGRDREADLGIDTYIAHKWFIQCLLMLDSKYGGSSFTCDRLAEIYKVVNEIGEKHNNVWSIRLMLTTLGTDIMVNLINPLYWCNLFVDEFMKRKNEEGYFVVVDVRQPIEIALMRAMGAKVLHIQRDTGIVSTHSTEKGILPIDGETVIINNGTLEEFESAILANI